MHKRILANLEFDFVYLARLTGAGLKPLSRWEKPLYGGELKFLEKLHLQVSFVRRLLGSGASITELIFAPYPKNLDMYTARFDGALMDRSAETQYAEGFFFGFPPCCIEHYTRYGYSDNGLSREDQQLLFHWSCPGCTITPLLLPAYRLIYEECKALYGGKKRYKSDFTPKVINQKFVRRSVAVAASLAVAATGLGMRAIALPGGVQKAGDLHLLPIPVEMDSDQDFLLNQEEAFLGSDPHTADENLNGVQDGIDLATSYAAIITTMPRDTLTTAPYAIDVDLRGIESCKICGATVNMGYVKVVNPLEHQSIDLPNIALHFMEHGSFQFEGTAHCGRVEVSVLKTVLESQGGRHLLPVEGDADGDGLSAQEETALGMNPAIPDENSDGILDGVWLAQYFKAIIDSLPYEPSPERLYAEPCMMYGLETCEICGATVNMGFWRVVNPATHDTVDVHEIGLHYLEHGSFSYHGNLHQGRIDPVELARTLAYTPSPVSVDDDTPATFGLLPNYPNPFNGTTLIFFNLGDEKIEENAALEIYTVLGQLVRSWAVADAGPGLQHITWDSRDSQDSAVPAGVYLVRLQAGENVGVRKITLLR